MEDNMNTTEFKAFLITLLKVVRQSENTQEVEEFIKDLLETL